MKPRRRFADDTSVSVGKSQEQINRMLRDWDCRLIQWTDDRDNGAQILRFIWSPEEGQDFAVEYRVVQPTDDEIAAEYKKPPTEKPKPPVGTHLRRPVRLAF